MEQFLEAFKANVPLVKQEAGCIEYAPTVDVPANLPPQVLDASVVTIVEKWESIEALQAHASAPHMLAYREKVKDIVEGMAIKVLEEA